MPDNKTEKESSKNGDNTAELANVACKGCGLAFPSKNKLFKHLQDTDGICLKNDPQEYADYCKYVRKKKKPDKVVILFGYLPIPETIRNGTDAATLLIKAIHEWERQQDGPGAATADEAVDEETVKFNRSYGHDQRGVEIVAQDNDTGATTEVLSLRLQPLAPNVSVDQFLDGVQAILDDQFASEKVVPIRIMGRQIMKHAKFNAEMDSTHRRVEYVLPIDFLSWSSKEIKDQLDDLPSFSENHKHSIGNRQPHNAKGSCLFPNKDDGDDDAVQHEDGYIPPDMGVKKYLHKLKKLMQSLATPIVQVDMEDKAAVMEKGFSLQKRKGQAKKSNRTKRNKKEDGQSAQDGEDNDEDQDIANNVVAKHKMLKRKRFHNFTETVMAHEYLSYRRLDRMYHRACLRFPQIDSTYTKPFLILSLTGDLFLTGQVLRVIGLFLSIANGLIDSDIVDCVFDEEYPHLIPTPPVPSLGMMAGEANYMTWEGKVKAILTPRNTDRYANGWNQMSTLQRFKDWQDVVHEEIARRWLARGTDEESDRLVAEKEWTEQVLIPWAEKANQQLSAYREWVKNKAESKTVTGDSQETDTAGEQNLATPEPLPSIVDDTVPELFEKVLFHLRKIDETGQWPSTTLKRQLVMVSTNKDAKDDEKTESLSMAHMKAKNNKEARSSAYSFAEGQGGASGSFSVGYMPGGINKMPKSNSLFPELVHAAFELETKLFPNRASSTIAINRNAQFRPHTDSGAGAGQSTSLIVGLGNYSGGELMVEGEKHDIRYKAIEFNGWTQRHWTLPFAGERYSLVWFTPKGCEGMRGIDIEME